MNGEKTLQNMMMDYSVHKVSFLNFIAPNGFLKMLDYFSYTGLGNVRNTAVVNHSRCCAIAEIVTASQKYQFFLKIWVKTCWCVWIFGDQVCSNWNISTQLPTYSLFRCRSRILRDVFVLRTPHHHPSLRESYHPVLGICTHLDVMRGTRDPFLPHDLNNGF